MLIRPSRQGREFTTVPDPMAEGDKLFEAIKILKRPYAGVVVRVGMLKFKDHENSDGTLTASFDFEVVSAPDDIDHAALHDDPKFNKILGDSIMAILEEQLGAVDEVVDEFFKGTNAGEPKT
jgi:hypothetical protein